LAFLSIPFLLLALLISKPLNAFLMGEDYAKSIGVNPIIFSGIPICV